MESPLTISCDLDTNLGCTACRQLCCLENRISELLDQKQRHLTALNAAHDKLTRRLPIELCSRIFHLSTLYYSANLGRATPLLIGCVSKGWRSIVLASPQIWSSPNIMLNNKRPIEEGVRVISDILSRSRNLPLCISVEPKIFYDRPLPNGRLFRPLLDVIRGQAARWESLQITGQWEVANYLLFDCPNATLLNKVDIETDDWGNQPLPSAENLPSPHSLSIRGWEFGRIPVNWERVTVFEGIDHFFHTVLEIIRHSPSLERYEDYIQYEGFEDISSRAGAVNPGLKALDLTFYDGEEEMEIRLSTLLKKLTLPSLEQLGLHIPYRQGVILNGINDFLQRSSCSLTYLSLTRPSSGLDVPIVVLLYLTPHLKVLEISDNDRTFIKDLFGELARTARPVSKPEFIAGKVSEDIWKPTLLPALEAIAFGLEDGAKWMNQSDVISVFPPVGPSHFVSRKVHYRPMKKLSVWRSVKHAEAEDMMLTLLAVQTVHLLREGGCEIEITSDGLPNGQRDLVEYSREYWVGKTAT